MEGITKLRILFLLPFLFLFALLFHLRRPKMKTPSFSGNPPKASSSPKPTAQSSPPRADTQKGKTRTPIRSSTGIITLHVLDPSGKPVVAAKIFRGPAKSRLAETYSFLLGKTNEGGRFVVSEKDLNPAKESIVVKKAGYLPILLQNPVFGREYPLLMKPGHTLALMFKDTFNRPLKGIEAWASHRVWPGGVEWFSNPVAPCQGKIGPENLIHHSISDEEGLCRIEGLPPGPVTLRVYSMGYATVYQSPAPPLNLPCGQVTFTMAPLYAISVKVRHDRMEYATMTLTSGDLFGGGTPFSDRDCWFWADFLKKKRGADYAVVSPILEGWKGEEPETVGKAPVHLLLAERGWITADLTIRRLRRVLKPEIFDASKLPKNPDMGRLRISIVNPDGSPLPYEKIPRNYRPLFWLEPVLDKKDGHTLRSLGCYPEETKSLPSGRYRATLPENWIHLFLEGKNQILRIEPGRLTKAILRTKEFLVPFRLDIKGPDGAPVEYGSITIEASGYSGSFLCRGFLSRAIFFAPLGPTRITVEPPKFLGKIDIQRTFGIEDIQGIRTVHALASSP